MSIRTPYMKLRQISCGRFSTSLRRCALRQCAPPAACLRLRVCIRVASEGEWTRRREVCAPRMHDADAPRVTVLLPGVTKECPYPQPTYSYLGPSFPSCPSQRKQQQTKLAHDPAASMAAARASGPPGPTDGRRQQQQRVGEQAAEPSRPACLLLAGGGYPAC